MCSSPNLLSHDDMGQPLGVHCNSLFHFRPTASDEMLPLRSNNIWNSNKLRVPQCIGAGLLNDFENRKCASSTTDHVFSFLTTIQFSSYQTSTECKLHGCIGALDVFKMIKIGSRPQKHHLVYQSQMKYDI